MSGTERVIEDWATEIDVIIQTNTELLEKVERAEALIMHKMQGSVN